MKSILRSRLLSACLRANGAHCAPLGRWTARAALDYPSLVAERDSSFQSAQFIRMCVGNGLLFAEPVEANDRSWADGQSKAAQDQRQPLGVPARQLDQR